MRADTAMERPEESCRVVEGWSRATSEQAAVGLALVAPDGRLLRINHKLPGADRTR